ncbi:hypothetical protein A3H53_02350 [Candidatus Nomurabacteria bacterium RIFCSPLOWO2_02_FULL_40_10]|uniref:Uncharacterized protein n=2 Tax=Candidatus Nomuraibacteriota TaxID=1752729 RepID=A0A1F6Y0G2_9BACT|nr:MAG: hypothetical protein A2642_01080 [Candidatus Nomurabacteria bacterium RIFCSPHIGHO2_01_FULL_39_10]OGI99851.1 MAG: hypothetical protein A3H53_02350 [Candidatus Nomurabacteria bacterium RIFCSPLOWO2_02_FULL_40_10]
MLPEKIIFVGVLINLFCSLWYIKNIFHGGIKPNLVSWFMWMLAPFFGFFFMIQAGTGLSALPVFMAGFSSLLIFIFSILHKNAYWKINNFDLICGLISLTSLILYVFTHNLGISILFAIISDSLAYIPTIIKSWKFPETESSSTYVGGLISNALSMLIIKNWIFSIYSFNISILIMNLVVIFCIYRKKIFK